MQSKLEKARQYKKNVSEPAQGQMAPIVRPDTLATRSSADGSALETDFLVANRLQADAVGPASELAPFVISERSDTSAALEDGKGPARWNPMNLSMSFHEVEMAALLA